MNHMTVKALFEQAIADEGARAVFADALERERMAVERSALWIIGSLSEARAARKCFHERSSHVRTCTHVLCADVARARVILDEWLRSAREICALAAHSTTRAGRELLLHAYRGSSTVNTVSSSLD